MYIFLCYTTIYIKIIEEKFMYYSITGKAVLKENFAVIFAGGVGYRIYTSNTTMSKITNGEEVTLYTYLNVKEDLMQLFGFITEEELNTFKMLIGVSGVGPKMALSILSVLSPAEFAMSVITQDSKAITRAHGVGKKLAEKIIVELKDKLNAVELSDIAEESGKNVSFTHADSIISEAINALMVLGYSSIEAKRAVLASAQEADSLEDVIKKALKRVGSI